MGVRCELLLQRLQTMRKRVYLVPRQRSVLQVASNQEIEALPNEFGAADFHVLRRTPGRSFEAAAERFSGEEEPVQRPLVAVHQAHGIAARLPHDGRGGALCLPCLPL